MSFLERILAPVRRRSFAGSADYWKQRYEKGGNSGAGSYGQVAEFKAETLNSFVTDHEVRSVIELGCGDGNQLSLAHYPRYSGFDIAPAAVAQCEARFEGDATKAFHFHTPGSLDLKAELALSLDVILHLVEDDVYETYMRDLFGSATRYVAIFAYDREYQPAAAHVRYRQFSAWIAANAPEWAPLAPVMNPYKGPDSLADFYFYERFGAVEKTPHSGEAP